MKGFEAAGYVHAYRTHYIAMPEQTQHAVAFCGAYTATRTTMSNSKITCPACLELLRLEKNCDMCISPETGTVQIPGKLLSVLWAKLATGDYPLRYDYKITGIIMGPTRGKESENVDVYFNNPYLYGMASIPRRTLKHPSNPD